MKNLLTESDLLWILAVIDGRVNEHYHEHYYSGNDYTPTNSVLGWIVKDILFRTGQMGRAMELFQYEYGLTLLLEKKEYFTLDETFWFAFKTWCFFLKKTDIKALTNINFMKLFDKQRSERTPEVTEKITTPEDEK